MFTILLDFVAKIIDASRSSLSPLAEATLIS